MATQAQINLTAYKSGKTPEEIQRLLAEKQGMASPAPIVPNQVPNLQQNAPVPGNTMDTSTGTPFVAPTTTPPATSWDVVGKQKDPASVSAYLNTQPGFKTSIVGNTVTGTKNGVNTTWIYDGANWVTKPTIATGDSPVIGTPPATTPTTTTTDFTVMTPEQLKSRYMEIGTKLPGEVTDEDRKFTRYLQTRMSLGETPDVIFGTKGTKSSGTTTYSTELTQPGENIASSERQTDGTYKVTYKDGTTQITTSEPSTTVFPEGTPEYFAQKQAQEANKRLQVLEEQLNTEAERRKKETADLVAKYGENIANQFQTQKAEIEANGAKRMDTLNSGLSFSGFGRSTLALEKRDEIAKNIETTINQAKAKADLELMAYRMEREGADEVAIAGMRKNIADVQQKIDDANYANQLEIIKLNQENATTGAEAMNNLLATISDSEEIVSNADIEKSQMLGYFVNKDGSIMLDSQKRPIQFEGNQGSLDPSAISGWATALKNGIIGKDALDKLSPADKDAILKHAAVQEGTYVPPAQGSGEMIMTKIGNKTVKVDTVALPGLQAAMASMPEGAYLGSTFRTYEEQVKLYEAYKSGKGGLAAPPGTSRHEKGMAVDLYSPGGKDPTPEMVAIMKANGWRQGSGNGPLPGDAGHFEYVGTSGEQTTTTSTEYNPDFESYYKKFNLGGGKGLNATETKILEKEFGSIANFAKQSKAFGTKIAIEQALPSLQDYKKDLQWLKDNYSVLGKAGSIIGVGDFDAILANVKNKQAFQELTRLKELGATFGALSEKEFANIGSSTEVGKLRVGAGKETWDSALDRLIRDVTTAENKIKGQSSTPVAENTTNMSNSSTETPQLQSDIFGEEW